MSLFKVFRRGWWPGPPPNISPDRLMCSDCVYHRAALAGWQWDRCRHPKADLGSVVRNDQLPTCADVRDSSDQCGPKGKWFTARADQSHQNAALKGQNK